MFMMEKNRFCTVFRLKSENENNERVGKEKVEGRVDQSLTFSFKQRMHKICYEYEIYQHKKRKYQLHACNKFTMNALRVCSAKRIK